MPTSKDTTPLPVILGTKSELLTRLMKGECELCRKITDLEAHHINKLKNLQKQWQSGVRTTGELCASKEAGTVRKGAVGVVTLNAWPPTLPMSMITFTKLAVLLPFPLSVGVVSNSAPLMNKAGLCVRLAYQCP